MLFHILSRTFCSSTLSTRYLKHKIILPIRTSKSSKYFFKVLLSGSFLFLISRLNLSKWVLAFLLISWDACPGSSVSPKFQSARLLIMPYVWPSWLCEIVNFLLWFLDLSIQAQFQHFPCCYCFLHSFLWKFLCFWMCIQNQ